MKPKAVAIDFDASRNVSPSMPYPRASAEVTNFTGERMPADTLAQEVVPEIYLNDVTLAPALPYRRGSLTERGTNKAVTPSLPYNKPTVDTANWFAYQK